MEMKMFLYSIKPCGPFYNELSRTGFTSKCTEKTPKKQVGLATQGVLDGKFYGSSTLVGTITITYISYLGFRIKLLTAAS
jgi:hypothetical protein